MTEGNTKVEGQGRQGSTSTSDTESNSSSSANNPHNNPPDMPNNQHMPHHYARRATNSFVSRYQGDGNDTFWNFFKKFCLMAIIAVGYCLLAEIIEGVYRGPDISFKKKHRRPIKWNRWP